MSMDTEVKVEHEIPAWMKSEIWAQARRPSGDETRIPRARIDMGGQVAFKVPEGVDTFLSGVSVYDAPEDGNFIGKVIFPIPKDIVGPACVHCTLNDYSH